MTLEKATKDMQALVAQHGFNYEGCLLYTSPSPRD